MDIRMLTDNAFLFGRRAKEELQPVLVKAVGIIIKAKLFLRFMAEQFRKLDLKDIALFKFIMLGFGFFLGLCAPRRFKKFKAVVFAATLIGTIVFMYRLLTAHNKT